MAEFLPPSMPEPTGPFAEQRPAPRPEPQPAPQPPPPATPPPPPPVTSPAPVAPTDARRRAFTGPGALGRLISLIVSVGLAWSLTVAITAWLLGLFLSRG